jgi:class 3 adenylate cyclase
MSKISVVMFTDIVGAVDLRNSLGETEYSKINARYRELFHGAAAKFKGAKVRQWMGDGCLATFESVSAAIKTALLVQHGLHIERDAFRSIAVRMGIDLGEISDMARKNSQRHGMSGLTIDRTSRIVNLSTEGRQILLSGSAFNDGKQLVGEALELPDGKACQLTWVNHGRFKLKGFPNPIEICEVGAPEHGARLKPPSGGLAITQVAVSAVPVDRDVFVSYAPDLDANWVASFSSRLKQSLGGRLNREISMWPAGGIEPGSDKHALEAIARSTAMAVLVSPGYLSSQRCRQELDAFLAQSGAVPPKERIVVVEAGEGVDRSQWPAALQNFRTQRFRATVVKEGASPSPADDSPTAFYKKLDALSTELTEKLAQKTADSEQADARPAVFLAEVPENAVETREEVKRYLAQMGFRVFPETWYGPSREEFRDAMLRDLQRCRVFAQFLGDPPAAPARDLPPDFISLQFEIAKEAEAQTFRWRSRELKANEVKDEAYKKVLLSPDVRSQSLEDAKQEIEKLANRSQSTRKQPFILFRASGTDEALALKVLERLRPIADRHNMGYEVADLYGDDDEVLGSADYGGLLILYGSCEPKWVRNKLKESKALLARNLTAYGVCKGPPPPSNKPLLYVIPGMRDFSTDSEQFDAELEEFVKNAAQVETSK